MSEQRTAEGWPTEPPIPLYGHGGACDRLRQEIATLDANCGIVAKHDGALAAHIAAAVARIDRVVSDMEGRP